MLLEEILVEWENDSKVDETKLGHAQAEVDRLHAKYLRLLTEANGMVTLLEGDYKRLRKLKHEYYLGTLSPEELKNNNWQPNPLRILRDDLSMYIDSDKEVIEKLKQLAIHREKVSVLTSIIKQINGRGFRIGKAIDYQKFLAGA